MAVLVVVEVLVPLVAMLVVADVASVELVRSTPAVDGTGVDRLAVDDPAADTMVVKEVPGDETSIDEVARNRFGVAEVPVEKIATEEDIVDIVTVDDLVLDWDKEAAYPSTDAGNELKGDLEGDAETASEVSLVEVGPLRS